MTGMVFRTLIKPTLDGVDEFLEQCVCTTVEASMNLKLLFALNFLMRFEICSRQKKNNYLTKTKSIYLI